MTEAVSRWAGAISVGFVLGIALSAWIDPQTSGGFFLVIIVSIALVVITLKTITYLRPHLTLVRRRKVELQGLSTQVDASSQPVTEINSLETSAELDNQGGSLPVNQPPPATPPT
jgi:hypothetical protein